MTAIITLIFLPSRYARAYIIQADVSSSKLVFSGGPCFLSPITLVQCELQLPWRGPSICRRILVSLLWGH